MIKEADLSALLVVDAANVVGSVPDGWWRDRAGATARLRERLGPIAVAGLGAGADVPREFRTGPLEVVLVVEGAARRISGDHSADPTVRTVAATGSGDDTIVDVVRAVRGTRPCLVITADRELRDRVRSLGADVRGPSVLPRRERESD